MWLRVEGSRVGGFGWDRGWGLRLHFFWNCAEFQAWDLTFRGHLEP